MQGGKLPLNSHFGTVSEMANVFPLRLPVSTRQIAHDLAAREGISLNQFIAMAVAEKIVRLDEGQSQDIDKGRIDGTGH